MGLDLIQIHCGRVREFYRVIDQELDLLADLGCLFEPVGFADQAAEGMAATTFGTFAASETR